MTNPFEKPSEMVPIKEQVLEVISHFAENFKVVRELADELGPYLIEVKIEGQEAGNYSEYLYMRKGQFPNKNATLETTIFVTHYEGEMPVGGENVASYNENTGEWN
jgi:hypothetical protein